MIGCDEVEEGMLISIGQFSNMTRLSVRALRIYAENGMLIPALVDESTGYRYYNLGQAKRAEIIRLLRSVDMPLGEIGKIIEFKDDEDIYSQLLIHRQRLSERVATQERMLNYLESIIQHKERVMPYEVNIEKVEPQIVATIKIKTTLKKITSDIPIGFGKLMPEIGRSNAEVSGTPMIVYYEVLDEEKEGDIEICIPIKNHFKGDSIVYSRELEGGSMATTLHRGPYEQITSAYHALASWIPENGYEVAGPPREIYLNDPQQVSPEELLTKIEFPVSKN